MEKKICQNSDKFGYSFIKNDMPLKAYVTRLHNLISMNIFFTIKEKAENKSIKKALDLKKLRLL